MKKLLLFLVLVLIPIAFAIPPVLQSQPAGGLLAIEYPDFAVYPNSDIKFHFHVHNSSGFIITNETTDCMFHLYNQTGSHIVEKKIGFESNFYDFDITVKKGNWTIGGVYHYILDCNSTNNEGGYVSVDFSITKDGRAEQRGETWVIAILIIPLLISFFFLIFAAGLGDDALNQGFKWFLRGLAFLMLFPSFIAAHIVINKYEDYNGLLSIFNIQIITWLFWSFLAFSLIGIIWFVFASYQIKKEKDFKDGVIK